jgi:hypothetical protein
MSAFISHNENYHPTESLPPHSTMSRQSLCDLPPKEWRQRRNHIPQSQRRRVGESLQSHRPTNAPPTEAQANQWHKLLQPMFSQHINLQLNKFLFFSPHWMRNTSINLIRAFFSFTGGVFIASYNGVHAQLSFQSRLSTPNHRSRHLTLQPWTLCDASGTRNATVNGQLTY